MKKKICHSFFPVYLYGAGPEWTACPGSESVRGCFSNAVWPAVGHKKRKRRKKKSNTDQTKVWGWFLCHFLSHRPLCPVMGLICVCVCLISSSDKGQTVCHAVTRLFSISPLCCLIDCPFKTERAVCVQSSKSWAIFGGICVCVNSIT